MDCCYQMGLVYSHAKLLPLCSSMSHSSNKVCSDSTHNKQGKTSVCVCRVLY